MTEPDLEVGTVTKAADPPRRADVAPAVETGAPSERHEQVFGEMRFDGTVSGNRGPALDILNAALTGNAQMASVLDSAEVAVGSDGTEYVMVPRAQAYAALGLEVPDDGSA